MEANHTVLNLDNILTKSRLLAERLEEVRTCNDEDMPYMVEGIKHLSEQIKMYVPLFKYPSCDKCYNSKMCHQREPSVICFEIIIEE